MSETVSLNPAVGAPHAIYLKDYTVTPYLIDAIDLHVDLNDEATLVKSHMRIRRNRLSTDKSNSLKLHGEELELIAIAVNGKKLDAAQYELTEHSLTIHNALDNFTLEITNRIFPQKNTALSGLYRSAKTYCTQCEAEGFRRITYFLDRPDVLARYTTTIVADAARYPMILSNGNLIESGKLDDGRHWAKWEDPFKKPSYLFALVAGDFDLLEDKFVTQSGRDVALRIYVEKGYGKQSHHAMHSVKAAMRWDEQAFGREYDLDIYMIVAIADFNMGAMENKGLNIFNTKYILAEPNTATDDDYIHIMSVIGHEYFHNWSGNRVTCRDWFQLSLKEGLTILRDQTFTEDSLSRAVMRIRDVNQLREIQFPEDASPLAHPVRPDSYIEINNFYTSTIYNKGAEVLRMMRTILGSALFRKGMDTYFATYDGQAATIEDYVSVMEAVSGIDLGQFRLWYSQAGTPVLTIKDHYDAPKKLYSITIAQSCPPTPNQPTKQPFHVPVKIALLNSEGQTLVINDKDETEIVLQLTQAEQTFQFANILEQPIPSLLRGFSAPVKVNFPYDDADLLFLAKYDSDPFNRWEAGQTYTLRTLLTLVQDFREGKALHLPPALIAMYAHLLQQNTDDLFLLAEMLHLPSEKYIGEQLSVVDVDAIHAAREYMLKELATTLHETFLHTYQRLHNTAPYQFSMEEIGKRQLKNLCLGYLLLLPHHAELGLQQIESALKTNMTDTLVALSALANQDVPQRQTVLDMFYKAWQHDALVMDKWFAIQAASTLQTTLQEVKKLLNHPDFDIKNPNKVYALIGTFGRNLINLHARNGDGYIFLREIIEQLDRLNPQIAARMVKPLTTWKRYDKERQVLMQKQLELLLQNKTLSRDVYELVTKSIK